MQTAPPMCMYCKNLQGSSGQLKCAAFPEGIPVEIAQGQFDHTHPHPGDHGVLFAAQDPDRTPVFTHGSLADDEDEPEDRDAPSDDEHEDDGSDGDDEKDGDD